MKKMINKKIVEIFNLEFPPYVNHLKIGDYEFKRIDYYKESFADMMHLVNSYGNEFETQVKTGCHQITAMVEIPRKEKACVLSFCDKKSKQLDDILFLLTIFTDRNVFKKYWQDCESIAITSDHRIHQYGGQLACSIQYESRWKEINTGELKTEAEMKDVPVFNYRQINIGFENTINKVLDLISSKKWQNEYEGGYFLFLFKSVIQRQAIETAFISC